jgi:hypothetical protein
MPEELRSVFREAPLLGFLEILGLAPRVFSMYFKILAESYSESAITAHGFKDRASFKDSSWGIITLVPLTLAARVTSASGSSDWASFTI